MRPPNHTRVYVKTQSAKSVNDPKFDMTRFDEVSRRIRWSENEFSHGLALQRTRRERRGCNRCVPCAGSLSLGRSSTEETPMELTKSEIEVADRYLSKRERQLAQWPHRRWLIVAIFSVFTLLGYRSVNEGMRSID